MENEFVSYFKDDNLKSKLNKHGGIGEKQYRFSSLIIKKN